jgi:hypothetical protein
MKQLVIDLDKFVGRNVAELKEHVLSEIMRIDISYKLDGPRDRNGHTKLLKVVDSYHAQGRSTITDVNIIKPDDKV